MRCFSSVSEPCSLGLSVSWLCYWPDWKLLLRSVVDQESSEQSRGHRQDRRRDLSWFSPSLDDGSMRWIRDGAWHDWKPENKPEQRRRRLREKRGSLWDFFFFSDLLATVMISQPDGASIHLQSFFFQALFSTNTFQELNLWKSFPASEPSACSLSKASCISKCNFPLCVYLHFKSESLKLAWKLFFEKYPYK